MFDQTYGVAHRVAGGRRVLSSAGAIIASLLVALTTLVAGASSASATTTGYYVAHSFAFDMIVARGNLTWYSRSVRVGGHLTDGIGACTTVVFDARTKSGAKLSATSRRVCRGSRGYGFTLPANIRGGAHHVWVDLYEAGSYDSSDYCVRSGCHSAQRYR